MQLRIAGLALVLALSAGSAAAQSIGIFWDPNAATCSVQQGQNSSGIMYVLATLGGPTSGGISGAEFRLDNLPSGWFFTPVANPAANVNLIDPLGIGAGTNIAFPACQEGQGSVVLLYTISYFATTLEHDRRLAILRHTRPSNPNFFCPLSVLCDAPVYTKICVTGGTGIINGPPCTVSGEQKSWSTVKNLYNN
jgi:hypothetical protein